jgi:anthranilate/para-aminobenzoate synthase component I
MKATVLIRTAVVSGGGAFPTSRAARPQIDYSVGAGIVADSVPRQEWRETLDKSAVLERLAESKKDQ